ncbi:MAG: MATE family efflux transporter, partial [Anaerolineae bacterium]
QFLSMLVGLVDTFLVGHLGAAPLAAVGLANQWIMFAMVLFSAVGTGATALIARMVGARDMDTANRVLRQAMLLALAFGAVMTAAIEIWAEPAMVLMGADAETVRLGVTFLTIAGSTYVFSSLMFIGNACLRGAGDTRTPLWVMLIVNGINIVVAWVLVNGLLGFPRLGVAGSATGAMLGRLVGGLLVIFLLWRGRSGLCLRSGRLTLDLSLVRRILRVGVPTGLEQLIFRLGMMSYVRVVATLGTIAYAAHQVAINAESLSYMPGFGF